MGSMETTRIRRSVHLAAGALALAVPAGALTLAPASTAAGAAKTTTARIKVAKSSASVLAGHQATVRGHLLPGLRGRKVTLLARDGGRWNTVASTRTGDNGYFDIPFKPSGGQESLRVHFDGDRLTPATSAPAGTVTVYSPTVASWYNDGGSTACGFHAYYGVANKTLPCGTHVSFRNGSKTVTATVDDRGPYVAGRDFDLNQNTAAALGFGGVGTVWASIS